MSKLAERFEETEFSIKIFGSSLVVYFAAVNCQPSSLDETKRKGGLLASHLFYC